MSAVPGTDLPVRKIERYGWRPDTPDSRDKLWQQDERVLTATSLPKKFSLRDTMPPVYDQGQLGSCTANGIAGCLEHEAMDQGEGEHTPSRLFVYYNERVIEGTVGEDAGAEIRDGIKSVAAQGAPPESLWPYDISKFAHKPTAAAYTEALKHEAIEYKRVLPGTPGSPIRTPLFTHQAPVVFGFSVPELFEGSWDAARDPLPLPAPGEGFIGGHAVVITGWDFSVSRPVFEIRNSWGDSWGDGGYFLMDAQWFWDRALGLTSDLWTILRVT